MGFDSQKLRAIAERGRALCADPEYAKRAGAIETRIADQMSRERDYRRQQCKIPRQFWPHIDGEAFQPRRDVAKWLEGAKQFALLAGTYGRGKSVALAWAVDQRGGRYVEAMEIAQVGLYSDELEDFIRIPLLAIDELGPEPLDDKGWGEAKFYRLLSARFQANRRTLLATNLSAAEFKTRYGSGPLERLWDRLTSSWDVFAYSGPSLRHWQETEGDE